MANIDNQHIQVVPVNNQLIVGGKGPLALRVILDFSTIFSYDLDLENIQQRNFMDIVQTIFVDNRTGTALTITIGQSGQVIVVKGNTQGYYNVMAPNPVRINFAAAAGAIVTVFLVNVAIPGVVWSTV